MNASGTRKNWSKPAAESVEKGPDWLRLIRESTDLVLLDDARGTGYSYLFRNPLEILRARTVAELPALRERLDQARQDGLHAAGYAHYEASEPVHPVVAEPANDSANHRPTLAWFGLYARRERVDTTGRNPARPTTRAHSFSLRRAAGQSLQTQRRLFHGDVGAIREHLARGDVYQINHTLETLYDFEGNPADLYIFLRRHQPAAHCAFIKTEDTYILSLSPELFFRAQTGADGGMLLETRPIKGTAPRAVPRNGPRDSALRESLKQDEKTRAENLMITDLLRNDLGRHAQPGSVKVPELFALESLPTLHQMYSVIQGELTASKAERLFRDVFPALFPCGSITGAPKLAARKIIHERESRPRGVYTGAIGFASPDEAVFSVAIRTLEIQTPHTREPGPMTARLGTGCGIVWDSRPQAEWRELLLKQAFLSPALDDFRVIETMLLSNGRVLLARRHALRMGRALRRFHIPRNYHRLRKALDEIVHENRNGHFRLRLTIDRDGRYETALAPLERGWNLAGLKPKQNSPRGLRLLLARERIWSGNPFRRFKTTEREIYDRAFAQARKQGYDDVLFLNERLEVAETCVANILIYDRHSGWTAPPEECGALPGTFLAYLEHRYPNRIHRRPIKLGELRGAPFVFTANSVRGLRRVASLHALDGRHHG